MGNKPTIIYGLDGKLYGIKNGVITPINLVATTDNIEDCPNCNGYKGLPTNVYCPIHNKAHIKYF